MKSRTTILVVDDHPVIRMGISSYLAREEHLRIVGEAADGSEAVAKARALLPDIVLLDIDLPKMSGLAVAEVLRKELPNTKVLILSMYPSVKFMPLVLKSGARGYVSKEAPAEELVKAIETVSANECYFSLEMAQLAINQFVQWNGDGRAVSKLTYREREVLILIAEGYGNKEIAANFNLSTRTVETHRERIMQKLDIYRVAGLTRYALANGMVTLRGVMAR